MGKVGEHTCTESLYTRVTTGSKCERITSMDKCEEAAKQLGLQDTEGTYEDGSGYPLPPYCYFYYGHTLYFNYGNSDVQCYPFKTCICHKYYRVTKGSTCERITSMAECELAAKQLGLQDTDPTWEDVSSWPPYCYSINGRHLWFNNNGNSDIQCNSDDKICICKRT